MAFLAVVALVGSGALPAQAQSSSQTAAQIAQAKDEEEKLHEELDHLAEDYVAAVDDLAQLNKDIEKSAAVVAQLEVELGDLQTAVGELALQTFVEGDQIGGLGEMLTDAGSITRAVERDQYAKLAVSAGVSATDQLDAKIHDLDLERESLARKQAKAEQLLEVIKSNQASIEKKTKEYEAFIKTLEVKFGKQKLAEEEARRDAERARETAAAIAAARARNSGGGGGNGGGGGTPRSGGTPGGASGGGGSAGGGSSGGGAGRNVPPPSHGAGGAVAAAQSQLGVPYKYASSSPGVAFDCSGLTAWAWGQAGVYLPHQSRQQYAVTAHIDPSDAQPGDLIFSHNPISHVGIYIGGGQMIHAPNSGDVVKVSGVNWGRITGVGRPG